MSLPFRLLALSCILAASGCRQETAPVPASVTDKPETVEQNTSAPAAEPASPAVETPAAEKAAEKSAPLPPAETVVLPDDRKALLMHYMPWYVTPEVRSRWGQHWTGWQSQHNPENLDDQGRPDIWSHYHPLIGTYDSTDMDVLECQLLQMKLAGVDGVIVDWYGLTDTGDYPENHEGSLAMFKAAEKAGMTFSVCFEDRSFEYMTKIQELHPDRSTNLLGQTFTWLENHWFSKPHYQKVNGRPLFLNFGPIYLQYREIWDISMQYLDPKPLFFGLHHLWQKAGADGGFMWVHQNAWKDLDKELIKRRLRGTYEYPSKDPEKVIASAYPGFRDIYANPHPVLEHRDGETMRESLEVCMDGPWPLIQLITWNDYGEGTMIEPTHEFGYTFLEIIQEARRAELGEAFPYSADDLQLPALLLEHRKRAGHLPEETLDEIANLLTMGATEHAKRMLVDLEETTQQP